MLLKGMNLSAARAYFTLLRRLGPEGRARLGFALTNNARRRLVDSIRQSHPEYTESQVHLAFLQLVLGEELFREVCAARGVESLLNQPPSAPR